MIYVATWGSFVKIGSSLNPPRRVTELPYGAGLDPDEPGRPTLVGYVRGDIQGERLLYAALAEHRVIGEWFDGTAPAVAAVLAEAARHPDGPGPDRIDGRTVPRERPRGYRIVLAPDF
jgi:hypothetical protein